MNKRIISNKIIILFICIFTLFSFSFFENNNVKADNTYTITYELNGGTNDSDNPSTYDGSIDITLKNPTRTGYTFNGWEVLLDGYTVLDYLKSTGTQYIKTGIIPKTNIKTEIAYKLNDDITKTGIVFGSYIGNQNYYINNCGSSGVWIGIGTVGKGPNIGWDDNKHTVSLIAESGQKPKWVKDNGEITIISDSSWSDILSTGDMYLFACNKGGSVDWFSHTNIYSFKVWANNVLQRDMIPVKRNSDSVYGMFDLVNTTFYPNNGTGTFEASAQVKTASIINKGSKGDRKFAAKWTAIESTVTFNKQSGTGGDSTTTATYDSDMPVISTPNKEKHIFKGYYDQTSGGTQYYNSQGQSTKKWDKLTDTILYAQWDEITATPSKNNVSVGRGNTSTVNITFTPSSVGSTASFKSLNESIATASYASNVLTITGVTEGTTSIQIFENESKKTIGTEILQTINVTVTQPEPAPKTDPGDMPYNDSMGFYATITPGAIPTVLAHITNATTTDTVVVRAGTTTLTENVDYRIEAGSIKIVFLPAFLSTITSTKILNINVRGKDFRVTILTPNPETNESSSVSSIDRSCEKVIGPTWHWSNSKGICEEYGVVGTSTR